MWDNTYFETNHRLITNYNDINEYWILRAYDLCFNRRKNAFKLEIDFNQRFRGIRGILFYCRQMSLPLSREDFFEVFIDQW